MAIEKTETPQWNKVVMGNVSVESNTDDIDKVTNIALYLYFQMRERKYLGYIG